MVSVVCVLGKDGSKVYLKTSQCRTEDDKPALTAIHSQGPQNRRPGQKYHPQNVRFLAVPLEQQDFQCKDRNGAPSFLYFRVHSPVKRPHQVKAHQKTKIRQKKKVLAFALLANRAYSLQTAPSTQAYSPQQPPPLPPSSWTYGPQIAPFDPGLQPSKTLRHKPTAFEQPLQPRPTALKPPLQPGPTAFKNPLQPGPTASKNSTFL